MTKRKPSRRALLASVAGALAGCSSIIPGPTPSDENNPGESADVTEPSGGSAAPDASGTYKLAARSVGKVRAEGTEGNDQGSGWIYDRENNLLVTAEHIATAGSAVFVSFPQTGWVEASVVGANHLTDIALLEVSTLPEDVDSLPVQQTLPPVGSEVATIGYPLGNDRSLSVGTLAGKPREFRLLDSRTNNPHGIQIDTALNGGDSGGPVVTPTGRVIGGISAGEGQNIGYAVSSILIERVVPALRDSGTYEHPRLGVRLQNVTPRIKTANGLTRGWGVYVTSVDPNGPASDSLSGLADQTRVRGQVTPVGGDVIVSLNRDRIRNVDGFAAWLTRHAEPGDTVSVGIVRDGDSQFVDVTLGARTGRQRR